MFMKKPATLVLTLLLTLGLSSVALASETIAPNTIKVNGNGIVEVMPDIATISLTFEETEDTALKAQEITNKNITKVTDALENLSIPKENITTEYSSVRPHYDTKPGTNERELVGYRSYANINVETKNLDDVGIYIDTALQAGATGYNHVNFSLENPSLYYAQALTSAIANAKISATAISDAVQKPLGAIQSIEENSSMTYYNEDFSGFEEISMDSGSSASSEKNTNTKITYSALEVNARITAIFGF